MGVHMQHRWQRYIWYLLLGAMLGFLIAGAAGVVVAALIMWSVALWLGHAPEPEWPLYCLYWGLLLGIINILSGAVVGCIKAHRRARRTP